MIPKDLTKDVINRLKTVKGQIEGIIRMLEKDNDPEKILNQFKASENGLQKAHYLLLDEVLRKALAIKIVETIDACPGNCGNEDKIAFLFKQFPDLKTNQITHKLKEISDLEDRLKRYNSENK